METCKLERPLEDLSVIRTPVRRNRRRGRSLPDISKRRSLFERDGEISESSQSELSNISPLSTASSEVYSPPMTSPATPLRSPLKIITPLKNFDQLLIGTSPKRVQFSPLKVARAIGRSPLKVGRSPRSPRVRGVTPLGVDHGLIAPNKFYGGGQSPLPYDGAALFRKIRAQVLTSAPPMKARTRLFLDDLPRRRKRPHTTSGIPSLGRPPKKKAKKSPVFNQKSPGMKPKIASAKKSATKSVRLKKRVCNWEVFTFTKPAREELSSTPTSRKFFSTSLVGTPTSTLDSSITLTPPPTTKKKRMLLDPYYNGFLDEEKIVEEIRSDVLEMMSGEEDNPVREEVNNLLEALSDDKCMEEDVVEELEPEVDPEDTENQYFPIFTRTPTSGTPSRKDESVKKKNRLGVGSSQLQLDVGQKGLRETQCIECGLLYCMGDPEDRQHHDKYHKELSELRHPGWKNERLASLHPPDRIIMVGQGDPHTWRKKAQEVVALADAELGTTQQYSGLNPTVYLYVKDKRIVGCAVAEGITKAYKLLATEGGVDICSEEEYKAKCGVNRIWVHAQHRRSGIASRLLDAIRRNFMYGTILSLNNLAFTVPTEQGKLLAAKYTKKKEFLVYM